MDHHKQHAIMGTIKEYAAARVRAAEAKHTGLPESARTHEVTARRLYASIKTYLRNYDASRAKELT
jgi:hypothetical protein